MTPTKNINTRRHKEDETAAGTWSDAQWPGGMIGKIII
jgi:hypothetical protein